MTSLLKTFKKWSLDENNELKMYYKAYKEVLIFK